MLIRCGKCGRVIDLNTQYQILEYLKGLPIKCRCRNEIFYESYEETKNVNENQKNKNKK